jgi:hypothetical protein
MEVADEVPHGRRFGDLDQSDFPSACRRFLQFQIQIHDHHQSMSFTTTILYSTSSKEWPGGRVAKAEVATTARTLPQAADIRAAATSWGDTRTALDCRLEFGTDCTNIKQDKDSIRHTGEKQGIALSAIRDDFTIIQQKNESLKPWIKSLATASTISESRLLLW